jgi:carboxyl-terminal processing protease
VKKKYSLIIGFFAAIILLSACRDRKEDEKISSEDSIYVFIDEIMNSWYYWYDQVPEVDIFQYNEPADLLDALVYKPLDKWSFIDDTTTLNALFEEGVYFGLGFMMRFDAQNNLRVIYVFENSEAYAQGIRKGNIIQTINGTVAMYYNDFDPLFDESPQTYTFQVLDNNLVSHEIILSKMEITQNAVFSRKIFSHISGKKIGYLVYEDFLGYSKPDLDEAFTYFKDNQVNELIVDLRYNGGGYISLAQQMAEMIVPASAVNHEFVTYSHNAIVAPYYDTTYMYAENALNLGVDRVFFITTEFTASASELVINCLEPYMDVYLIGSTTHGKPVGMYGFPFHEWLLYPITVSLKNAEGYGDFFDGLPVDCAADESLDTDWGDQADPNISQALYFIANGSFNKEIRVSEKTKISYPLSQRLLSKKSLLLLDR